MDTYHYASRGGFAGIANIFGSLLNRENTEPIVVLISIAFMALYAFVTIAGVLFALDERRTKPLRLALCLQIPLISSPLIAYRFSAGFSLIVALIGTELGVNFWLGSIWQFNLFGELPWGIGINLFALLMLFLIRRYFAPQTDLNPSWQNGITDLKNGEDSL